MQKTLVRDVMTSPVRIIAPDTTIPDALALMREAGIRHLPVVQDGRLAGIVSKGDLREASRKAVLGANSYEFNFLISRLTVDKIMTRNVLTVAPETPVLEAVQIMSKHKIAGLPVLGLDAAVVGIVTESDMFRLLARLLRDEDRMDADQ